MGRPKEFARNSALEAAKVVFWRQGYNATTTEQLRRAMGIGRQSFYDSFVGKRETFLEVLRRYNEDGVSESIARARSAPSSLAAIERLLSSVADEPPARRGLGCLGVMTMCELGVSDADVAEIGASSNARLLALLEELLRDAKAKGEVRVSVDERAAARQLDATILGMKVLSKAGATGAVLRDVARAAVDGIARRTRAPS